MRDTGPGAWTSENLEAATAKHLNAIVKLSAGKEENGQIGILWTFMSFCSKSSNNTCGYNLDTHLK